MRNKRIRFIYMISAGIIIAFLLKLIIPFPNNSSLYVLMGIFESVLITVTIWEGNLHIDTAIDKRIPWEKKPMKRIVIQLPITYLYNGIVLYGIMWLFNEYFCEIPLINKNQFFTIVMTIASLVSITVLSIETGAQFFRKWKKSLIEVEKYKMESAQAKLENLKNQINPHFLFNNMSVLSSLVYKDPDKAVDFIQQLSKVYRYMLDNRDCELVRLKDEMTFISSYAYLLHIRYSPNLEIKINLPEDQLNKMIPPLSLQLLLENAIKHNEISSQLPLTISLAVSEDYLVISNNKNPKLTTEPSCKTGLKNIQSRYQFFTEKEIHIAAEADTFTVKIPILSVL